MVNTMVDFFIGIDVQIRRGCPYYIVDSNLAYVDSGWLQGPDHEEICRQLSGITSQYQTKSAGKIAVGIDAPRMALPAPRMAFCRGTGWVAKSNREKGYGRHCEVVIKALGIANPQWTRPVEESPPWMMLGYRMFETLQDVEHVYEVFPSASYKLLNEDRTAHVSLSFADFVRGPKDMLDACVSAFTVHAFLHGQGFEVGGGDGLGTIILPGLLPVKQSHRVLHWLE